MKRRQEALPENAAWASVCLRQARGSLIQRLQCNTRCTALLRGYLSTPGTAASIYHLLYPFFLSEDLLLFSFTLWLPMVHTFGPQDLPSPIPYNGSFFSLLIFPLEPFAKVFLGTLQTSFQEPFLLFSHSIFFFLVAVSESSSTPLLKDIEQDAPDHYISPRRNVRLTPLPQLTHLAYSVPESFISLHHTWLSAPEREGSWKPEFEYGALPGGLNCRSYYLLDPSRLTLEQAHPRPTFRTHSRLIRLHCRYTESNGLFN